MSVHADEVGQYNDYSANKIGGFRRNCTFNAKHKYKV